MWLYLLLYTKQNQLQGFEKNFIVSDIVCYAATVFSNQNY